MGRSEEFSRREQEIPWSSTHSTRSANMPTWAWHYIFARQYDEAIEQCWKFERSFFPNSFFFVLLLRASAYEQKGMLDEASAEFEKVIKMSGNLTFAKAGDWDTCTPSQQRRPKPRT